MRHLHVRSLVRRPKHRGCPDPAVCAFRGGQCETCGFRLVDTTRDEMRRRDPRY